MITQEFDHRDTLFPRLSDAHVRVANSAVVKIPLLRPQGIPKIVKQRCIGSDGSSSASAAPTTSSSDLVQVDDVAPLDAPFDALLLGPMNVGVSDKSSMVIVGGIGAAFGQSTVTEEIVVRKRTDGTHEVHVVTIGDVTRRRIATADLGSPLVHIMSFGNLIGVGGGGAEEMHRKLRHDGV